MIKIILFEYIILNFFIWIMSWMYDKMNNIKEDYYFNNYSLLEWVGFFKWFFKKAYKFFSILLFGVFILFFQWIKENRKKEKVDKNGYI